MIMPRPRSTTLDHSSTTHSPHPAGRSMCAADPKRLLTSMKERPWDLPSHHDKRVLSQVMDSSLRHQMATRSTLAASSTPPRARVVGLWITTAFGRSCVWPMTWLLLRRLTHP